jgi:hypothetical protein
VCCCLPLYRIYVHGLILVHLVVILVIVLVAVEPGYLTLLMALKVRYLYSTLRNIMLLIQVCSTCCDVHPPCARVTHCLSQLLQTADHTVNICATKASHHTVTLATSQHLLMTCRNIITSPAPLLMTNKQTHRLH